MGDRNFSYHLRDDKMLPEVYGDAFIDKTLWKGPHYGGADSRALGSMPASASDSELASESGAKSSATSYGTSSPEYVNPIDR